MGRKVSEAESEAVLLRTTVDIISGALTQLDCCVQKWPQYQADATAVREVVERMVRDAKEYGYIEKRGKV